MSSARGWRARRVNPFDVRPAFQSDEKFPPVAISFAPHEVMSPSYATAVPSTVWLAFPLATLQLSCPLTGHIHLSYEHNRNAIDRYMTSTCANDIAAV